MEIFKRQSNIPLYKQAYSWMKEKILNGDWEPGKQIPPEPVLSVDLGISRQTLRQAMQMLINEGFLYRQPGRGTFVQYSKSNYRLSYLYSFSEQMRELGKEPSSKIIDIKTNYRPSDAIANKLMLKDTGRVHKIVRLRLADGQPMSIERVYIDVNLCPDLHTKDLDRLSLYTILENEYKLQIKHGDISLQATMADEEQAALLQIPSGSPLLYMKCLTFLQNQRPAFLTLARYPYDKYLFTISMPRKNEEN
ncbi:GntR family transcriptional regulator [Lysinibacillus piscis]|uniref:HTH-type transcriptional repressor YvoA n=1 Tax=Lysinibacillus piscis TaxID=2518931 RepID=A0ABQ5NMB7_9BACI|nr:GntR family transcriptional regulator [Lysinibacillus sp. KH24]GLC89501.1 HTH-type transcriptional repressor YvoA [Lysinibacillus sp. KH24]